MSAIITAVIKQRFFSSEQEKMKRRGGDGEDDLVDDIATFAKNLKFFFLFMLSTLQNHETRFKNNRILRFIIFGICKYIIVIYRVFTYFFLMRL